MHCYLLRKQKFFCSAKCYHLTEWGLDFGVDLFAVACNCFYFFLSCRMCLYLFSEAAGRAELGIGLAKKRYNDDSTTNFVPGQLFTFLSKFLPFSPSFNLQKLFLMFSTFFHNLSKRHSEKTSLAKKFSEQKKLKKLFIFFFEFFLIFFSLSKTYSTPFSFYFIVIHLLPKKNQKKHSVHFNLLQILLQFRANQRMV